MPRVHKEAAFAVKTGDDGVYTGCLSRLLSFDPSSDLSAGDLAVSARNLSVTIHPSVHAFRISIIITFKLQSDLNYRFVNDKFRLKFAEKLDRLVTFFTHIARKKSLDFSSKIGSFASTCGDFFNDSP